MALARYEGVAQDSAGNVIALATVEVRRDQPGRPIVPLFSDRNGTVAIGNPFTANELGQFAFHAPGGAYYVRVYTGPSQAPFQQFTKRYQAIGTAAERDVEELASALNAGIAIFALASQLDAFVPDEEVNVGARVLNDPDPTKNGDYIYVADAWVRQRGFPDTMATLTYSGGTPNALTASLDAGIDPATIKIFTLFPAEANTGPVTVNGVPVLSSTNAPLAADAFLAGYLVVLINMGDHYVQWTDPRLVAIHAQVQAIRDEVVLLEVATQASADAAVVARELTFDARDAAQVSEGNAELARDVAVSAAEAVGVTRYFATKSAADAALAGLANDAVIQVWVDETRDNSRVGYQKVAGAYVFRVNYDTSDPHGLTIQSPNIARYSGCIFPSDVYAEADRAVPSTQRRARLQVGIDRAAVLGKTFVFPSLSQRYLIDGYLRPRKGSRIILEGYIWNEYVRQVGDTDGGSRESVFRFGNMHPVYLNQTTPISPNVATFSWYAVDGQPKGHSATFTAGSNRTNALAAMTTAGVGSPVWVRTNQYYLANDNDNGTIPELCLIAHIVAITTSGLVLDVSLPGLAGDYSVALCNQPTLLDIEGLPIEVADDVVIEGNGGFGSVGRALTRTAGIDVHIDVDEIRTKDRIGGNGLNRSSIRTKRFITDGGAWESAMNSYDFKAYLGDIDVRGTGTTEPLIKIGENSRHILVNGKLNAGDRNIANGSLVLIGNVDDVRLEMDINAPSGQGNAIVITNGLRAPSGLAVQPKTTNVTLALGDCNMGSSWSRFVYSTGGVGDTATGQQNKNFLIERAHFIGSATLDPVVIDTDLVTILDAVEVESGALNLTSHTTKSQILGPRFEGGLILSGTDIFSHTVKNFRSASQRSLRDIQESASPNDVSTTTTAGADVHVFTVPAGTVTTGDRIRITAYGRWNNIGTSTHAAKFMQLTDDTGTIAAIEFAAGANNTSGTWRLVAEILIASPQVYTFSGQGSGDSIVSSVHTPVAVTNYGNRRTSLNLNTVARNFTLERWLVGGAGVDTITVDYYELQAFREWAAI